MNIERERPIITSIILGHGYKQPLIATAATAIGSIFCLPASFFRNIWFFLQYIAAIVCAIVIATACHAHHLGLMICGFTGNPKIQHSEPEEESLLALALLRCRGQLIMLRRLLIL
ncbi:hypothetical protein ACFXTO_037851 [Malus domestica]